MILFYLKINNKQTKKPIARLSAKNIMEFTKQANELLKQAVVETEKKDFLIEEAFKDLDDEVIFKIVNYWYNHKTSDIFQNENGADLQEYLDFKLDENI